MSETHVRAESIAMRRGEIKPNLRLNNRLP